MKYYRYLYVSDSINNIDKVKKNLKAHKGVLGIYVIMLSSDPDQVEIMNAAFLRLNYYIKHPPIIVGIAKTYDEALMLVKDMVDESLFRTGSASLKDFLKLKASTENFS
ncbi:MAG: hypothetical protein K6A38_03130 [Lachnospiraceae bacterium]|nr:hypothetical protein [Lachnospiraceae bacterium]